MDIIVKSGSHCKDAIGERVDFKKPYFDDAFRRVFKSAEEKSAFMKAHGFTQNGDSDEKVKKQRKEQYEQQMDERKRR